MKRLDTPLKEAHLALGARMVPFAGWRMPLYYGPGIIKEHRHTRERASLFDTCHMGEFGVSGKGAAEVLDGLLARAVSDQSVGSCHYNFLLTEDGGVRDDLIVYRLGAEEFYLVVNAATRAADADWLRKRIHAPVSFLDESSRTGKLDLQGPTSAEILMRLGVAQKGLPSYYHWCRIELNGEQILLSRTGYTGELGFEFYLAWEKAALLWERLLKEDGVQPAGLGARDTLRLEMGFPLYGHELDSDTTPVEAGFGSFFKGGRLFVGDSCLRRTPRKRLIGLVLEGRRAARRDDPVLAPNGRRIGKVTSGSYAPSLDRAVALAYIVGEEKPGLGTAVLVGEAAKPLEAVVTRLPFYREGTAKKNVQGEGDS
jgi:aminomethyltransferase